MKENRVNNVPVRFWSSPEMHETVQRIADASGRTVSSVYRDLVEKGLAAAGYRSGSQDISGMVRNAVEEAIKPQIDRLASISAKAAQISAADFFMAYYVGLQNTPEYLQESYNETAAQARKLGIQYLKLSKDQALDAFIQRGMQSLADDKEGDAY